MNNKETHSGSWDFTVLIIIKSLGKIMFCEIVVIKYTKKIFYTKK